MRARWASTLVLVAAPLGCPVSRSDGGGGGAASTSASAILPAQSASARGRSALPESAIDEATAGVALRAGVPLTPEPPVEGDVIALRLELSMRRMLVLPPSREPSFGGRAATLVAELAAGRARVTLGAGSFALADGSELRLARGYVGALWMPRAEPSAAGPGYRVLPPGALRTFLAEGRADVVPFAPTRVVTAPSVDWQGRKAERVTLTTSYGRLVLDQVLAPRPTPPAAIASASASSGLAPSPSSSSPPSPTPAPSLTMAAVASIAASARADAGRPMEAGVEPPQLGLDGAGEPLCRILLELVASDRVLGGAPCDPDRVPVRAEITWATGGGLLFEAGAWQERPLPRGELAFPPPRARMIAAPALGDGRTFPLDPVRGDTATLELVDGALLPRVAIVDGVVLGWIAPGKSLLAPVPKGRRRVEWQSLLGEAAEPAVELEVPARVVAGQASPTPLPSASAIASARVQP
jgi:hypothetical protein